MAKKTYSLYAFSGTGTVNCDRTFTSRAQAEREFHGIAKDCIGDLTAYVGLGLVNRVTDDAVYSTALMSKSVNQAHVEIHQAYYR